MNERTNPFGFSAADIDEARRAWGIKQDELELELDRRAKIYATSNSSRRPNNVEFKTYGGKKYRVVDISQSSVQRGGRHETGVRKRGLGRMTKNDFK